MAIVNYHRLALKALRFMQSSEMKRMIRFALTIFMLATLSPICPFATRAVNGSGQFMRTED